MRTAGGLAVVDPAAGRLVYSARSAVTTPDTARVFGVSGDSLTVLDGELGTQQATLPRVGDLVPTVVSTSGSRLALSQARADASPWLPVARLRTPIAIVDTSGSVAPHMLDLDGNFEPEAFSSDDRFLIVLQYLPAEAPEGYRVRRVELSTGSVEPLVDRFKGLPLSAEETMRGTGRQQVLSPDARVLYTLYTHQPDHLHGRDLKAGLSTARGDVHAFVHTLSLSEGWAVCVDLPLPFGLGAAEGHAIAITPDGGRVIVVDRTSGSMAAIDTASLEIRMNVPGTPDARPARGLTSAQVSPDGQTLYVAGGSELQAIDPKSLVVRQRWPAAAEMNGLAISADGQRLYLGLSGRVAVLEAATAREVASVAVPELRAVEAVQRPR